MREGVKDMTKGSPYRLILGFALPMFVMLSIWCVLRITYITTMMHLVHELPYIYWAYPITWGVSSVIFLLYYHFSDWIHGFEKAT